MRLSLSRSLCLALLGLLAGACQRQGYSFQPPAVSVSRAVPPRPDSAWPVRPVAAAVAAHTPEAARPAAPARLVTRPRARRPLAAWLHSPLPVATTQNAHARPGKFTAQAPRRRPALSENQVVALVLLGGGGLLTAAGLLLLLAVGGTGAVVAGILLSIIGLSLFWGWFYLRGLGKAYQH